MHSELKWVHNIIVTLDLAVRCAAHALMFVATHYSAKIDSDSIISFFV